MGSAIRRASVAAALLVVSVATVIAQPVGVPVVDAAGAFEPLSAPQRLLDTRPGSVTADGQFAGIDVRPAGSTLELPVAGRAGVSSTAVSVVLNVTVDAAREDGFVTVHPCDTPRPNASNLNYRSGQTIPNTVVTRLAPGGTVCLYTYGATHLIVDVAGVLAPDAFSPLPAPQRLLDTRPGSVTADGQFAGGGVRPAGSILELVVAGRAGVPSTASSVVLNVTVDAALEDGFATVFPCDAPQPNASNLNYAAGVTIPNAVVTRIGGAGTVCLFTFGATDLIVDVAGVFSTGAFNPLAAPQRVFDSRPLAATADGLVSGGGVQPRNTTVQLTVAGRVGVPADASAVVLNVTAVNALEGGFVTVHPRGTSLPNASNLNFVAGQNIPNAVITRVGPGGAVCFFTSGATHLIVDVAGWLTGPPPATSGPNCPSSGPTNSAEETGALLVRPALHPALGSDQIGVWVCDVPLDTTNPWYVQFEHVDVDPAQVAAWAQTTVAPYFAEVSRGRYSVAFTALGRIPLSSTDGPGECRDTAHAQTPAPYTNVLFTDTTSYNGGQAGPGRISSNPASDQAVLVAGAPNQTRRGAWVGGDSTGGDLSPLVVAHEIGHTLHWPHSYNTTAFEYDNRLDVMSGYPDEGLCTRSTTPGLYSLWPCEPQHTLAFNRFASGWVDGHQVAIHRFGTVNYTLDAPARDGLQFVALPDPSDSRSMLTLEARPRVGRDQFLGVEGVALHVVDQVPRSGGFIDGFSTGRRQRQALGASRSYDHVIGVGASLTVHGVTVTVLGRTGDSYEVTVSGSYRMPASNFFTDGFGTAVSCATLDITAMLERGCRR